MQGEIMQGALLNHSKRAVSEAFQTRAFWKRFFQLRYIDIFQYVYIFEFILKQLKARPKSTCDFFSQYKYIDTFQYVYIIRISC